MLEKVSRNYSDALVKVQTINLTDSGLLCKPSHYNYGSDFNFAFFKFLSVKMIRTRPKAKPKTKRRCSKYLRRDLGKKVNKGLNDNNYGSSG